MRAKERRGGATWLVVVEVVVQLAGAATLALAVWGWARATPAPFRPVAPLTLIGCASLVMCLPARQPLAAALRVVAVGLVLMSALLWTTS